MAWWGSGRVIHGMQEVWGSNPHSSTSVMSQDIGMTLNPHWVRGRLGFRPGGGGGGGGGSFGFRAWWLAGGLVVPGRVEGEFAQEFAGGGVDDPDVQVADEHQDRGPG